MSRIARAFCRRFSELLGEFGARQRDKGVQILFQQAQCRAEKNASDLSRELTSQNIQLARRWHRFRKRKGLPEIPTPRIICDAGLGGLARWLRAAGCDAEWMPDVDDGLLLHRALETNSLVITTDGFLLDRRLVTSGTVKTIWVPPTLKMREQLQLVLAELDIQPEPSRCMACGGELNRIDKESARDRIPPKTFLWIDEYFECSRCGKLFWEGTHWRRIEQGLKPILPA